MGQVQKIAILGGGVGAMTAAFYLSAQPGWRERYDITVYQQGWRLGGKGASGRNAQLGQRIEEHGLHIWFGFYANAFAMMRAAYAELGRPPGSPLATWDQAFRPHDYVALADPVGSGQWDVWNLMLPHRPGEPGTGSDPVTPWALALEAMRWLPLWHAELSAVSPMVAMQPEDRVSFDSLLALARALPADARRHSDRDRALLARTLNRIGSRLGQRANLAVASGQAKRMLIAINLGVTAMKGMLADGVFTRGFDAINGENLRDWLARHGGDPELCVNSTPVRAIYDLFFAYVDGDPKQPNLEAGTALRAALRMNFAYRGSVMYKMQAGMGDAVFAPLYQLLAARGVHFNFFHRVEELLPDGDGVGAVRMSVQAALKGRSYEPLVQIKGLPCWSSAPDYSQLEPEQAALMQEHGVDLESYWSDWPELYRQAFGMPLPERVLQRGRDFDHVVFGIPVGSLPAVAPRLLAASPALRAASERLRTIATEACQVWFDRDLAELGWTVQPGGQQPVFSCFSDPYDTWAPMDQVLPREDWPRSNAPKSVSYFCSAMHVTSYPPQSDTGFPARAAAAARNDAIDLLENRIGAMWPGARNGFQWQWLHDPRQGEGVTRFERQFWRANVDPSERYVLSVTGSTGYRPAANGSGLSNLYLAGDWIRTGLNAGCVEAAVMGGMQASRALSGFPEKIEADSDFPNEGGIWATT